MRKIWKDVTAILVLTATGFYVDMVFPSLGFIPRTGAILVIVAAGIAGLSSKSPVLAANDSLSISDLPHVDAHDNEKQTHQAEKTDRIEQATKSRDNLTLRVPIWAGFGTLLWGFGDLIP